MAAHEDINDFEVHIVDLGTADVAKGIDGPVGAHTVAYYLDDTVDGLIQFGGQTDRDATDITSAAFVLPAKVPIESNCSSQDSPMIGNPQRVTLYIQSPTLNAKAQVRFLRNVQTRGT